MSNYEKLKTEFMQDDEFVAMYEEAKNQIDLEYEVQYIKEKIVNNDKTFNILNALDALQKHIVDFTHQRRLA
jgi:hypothetical protein